MLLTKKHQKNLNRLWMVVGIITILGMLLLYSSSLFLATN
jgi:hypothetical protein